LISIKYDLALCYIKYFKSQLINFLRNNTFKTLEYLVEENMYPISLYTMILHQEVKITGFGKFLDFKYI